jgi:SAM-dependent methyltransferase
LDIGCGSGCLSGVLSLEFGTIGLDADRKEMNLEVQRKFKKLNFILADMRFLPFKPHSIDIIVCISVLEHCKDLEDRIKKIKNALKKNGIFIAGYPVETKFFKSVWKRVSPWSFQFIDCERAYSQPYWRNPSTGKRECYWDICRLHKQTYQKIRKVLGKNFKILKLRQHIT